MPLINVQSSMTYHLYKYITEKQCLVKILTFENNSFRVF